MHDPMLPLPGLSSVAGKRVEVKFDGGRLSSDGGLLALREIERRLRVAACLVDPRAPDQITQLRRPEERNSSSSPLFRDTTLQEMCRIVRPVLALSRAQ
jgi:hypothetical protein